MFLTSAKGPLSLSDLPVVVMTMAVEIDAALQTMQSRIDMIERQVMALMTPLPEPAPVPPEPEESPPEEPHPGTEPAP